MSEPDLNAITRTIAPHHLEDGNGITRTIIPDPVDPNATRTMSAEPVVPGVAPRRLPGYNIQSELGRGGMGVVYLATQQGLNRDVALKMVLSGGHASATERVRFLAEAESIASIQHPGIVQVFDFGTHAGQPFFAMEFLPGGSLGAKLAGTPIPAREAAVVVEKIARAVQAAHEKGIIHRDLKPSNILLSSDGSPKITDFGLARKTDSGSGLTQTGAVLGSPSYMSPEQAEGKHEQVGVTSDVYSVGTILYECLTGRPPFRAATPLDTVMQVIKEEPVPPMKLAAKIPRDLDTITLKCLNKDPGKRYTSAAELADDLKRFLNGETIIARPATLLEKYWKSVKKRPLLNLLILITAFSIGISIGILFSTNKNLRSKQIQLEKQTRDAEDARTDADTQRMLATQRLEKAVEAVEKVMVRVAGEKWALKPELLKERREVLEEAVSFFNGLGTEESKDPTVRIQSARANLFAASANISLSDYEKSRESVAVAQTLYRELQIEYPGESIYIRGEAEGEAILGHCDAISAQFNSALGHYEKVVELAKKAVEREPDRDENQTLVIDAYSSLALFYSFQRPDLSKQYHNKALQVGEQLLAKPSPPYKVRLSVATSLTNLGVSEVGTNPAEAAKKFERANSIIQILDKMTPPTSRTAESFVSTKAGLTLYRGVLKFQLTKSEEGLELAKSGVDMISQILKVQPKSFPFIIQHIQFQIVLVDILLNANRYKEAKAILEKVSEEQSAVARDQPQLSWIRGLGVMQKSNFIIYKLRDKFDPEFEEWARQLLDLDVQYVSAGLKYNVACLYAQAAALAPVADREKHAKKAIEILNRLLADTNYFNEDLNAKHLVKDTDLDPIRKRSDYIEFYDRVQASMKHKEKPVPKIEK